MKAKKDYNKSPIKAPKIHNDDNSVDLLSFLQQRIHKPGYNVFSQRYKRIADREYNWWKENQLLI
ncbi:MAG: hypothetical protein JW973_17625 [Bacteroidales bacterium]|nr:hypothetical protein [Bacteroidales bacterium]